MFKQIADSIFFQVSNSFDSNIIFIDAGESKILIDTGTGMYADVLNHELGKIGSSLESITDIVLTHSHIDHIGGVPPILSRSSPKIYLHKSEADMINSGDMRLTLSDTFGVEFPKMRIEGILEEGKDLTLGDICFRIYSTPGHSIGSICLLIEDKGILVTGDTLFPGGSFGRVDFPTGSPKQLVDSLKRITEWDFVIALPGHMAAIVGDAKRHAESSYQMARSMFRYQ